MKVKNPQFAKSVRKTSTRPPAVIAYVSDEEKELIRDGARKSRLTISQFVARAALRAARVAEEHGLATV